MRRFFPIFLLALAIAGGHTAAGFAATTTAAPGDASSAAIVVPPAGIATRVNTTTATSDAADPVPSCGDGKVAANTVWYSVTVPRPRRSATPATAGVLAPAGTLLTVSLKPAAHDAVVALYEALPVAASELACARGIAARAQGLQYLVRPGTRYLLQVGTVGATGGDQLDLSIVRSASDWRSAEPLAARRQAPAVTGTADALYSFGGYQVSFLPGTQTGFHSDVVNRLDLATGHWAPIAQMPNGLSYARATMLGQYAFIPGGRANTVNGTGCIDGTHYAFDTRARTWLKLASWSGPPMFDYAAAADPARGTRGVYYVAGGAWDPTPCDAGATTDDTQVAATARQFDPATGTWTDLPAMAHARRGAVAAVAGGVLYVLGGLENLQASAAVEAFDPRARTWARATDLPMPVYGAAAGTGVSPLGHATIVVAGGWNAAAGGDVGVTQVYDTVTRTWSVSKAHLTPRDAAGSGVAAGRLFVVGGYSGQQAVRSVDWLRIDELPPRLRPVAIVHAGVVRLSAAATDASGVASVVWALGDGRTVHGARAKASYAKAGRHRVTVTATDAVGNVAVRRLVVTT